MIPWPFPADHRGGPGGAQGFPRWCAVEGGRRLGTMQTDDNPTTTGPPSPGPSRRLTRSSRDKVVGGVAGGLAEYFGVDAVLFRIGFVALTVAGGSGIGLYALAWLLLPTAGSTETVSQRLSRWYRHRPILAIILTVVAVNMVFNGFWWGDHGHRDNDFFWGVVLVGVGVAFLVSRQRGRWDDATTPPTGGPDPDVEFDRPAPSDPLLADAARIEATGSLIGPAWSAPAPDLPLRPERPRPFLTPLVISMLLIGAGVAALLGVELLAFLAVALLVVGGAMLVGARWGRARGLIPVGLLLAAAATVTAVTDVSLAGGVGTRHRSPLTEAQLRPYRLGVGELIVDLRDLDVDGSARVRAEVGVGQITVLVPPDVDVEGDAHVGMGQVTAFGRSTDGSDVDRRFDHDAEVETSRTLVLDLDAGIGEIIVEVRDGAA